MTAAHDVHAETNPAFCAAVLAWFCAAHRESHKHDPALALAYLVLPIALSEDLAGTFEGCNKNTGMLVWIERSPRTIANLSKRVNDTLNITTDAIRFGCISEILHLGAKGQVVSGDKKIPLAAMTGPSGRAFARARLLGYWFANAGSARAVMEAMGVTV